MPTGLADKTPVRVIIVDDSPTIRRWLRYLFASDPRLQVVGEAGGAREARDLLRTVPVDVMTLDVDMPGMTGIEFLGRLMAHKPMPVVMVSALTQKGSHAAIQAFSLGAVDCIQKPKNQNTAEMNQDIRNRVWQAAQAQVFARRMPSRAGVAFDRTRGPTAERWHGDVILLGASTGGVAALESVLEEIDDLPAPIVMAQHMPEHFLRSFCNRLNEQFHRNFIMADESGGEPVELTSNTCVIALGKDVSTRVQKTREGRLLCTMGPPSEEALYRPNVNDLFCSAARAELRGAAALLTGMGADGAQGLHALRAKGFETYAQNEESCVVYGMPKAAVALDAARHVLSPRQIGKAMKHAVTSCATVGG